MRPTTIPTYLGTMFLSMFFLASITSTQPLRAQAAGASVSVRMTEAIDSGKDPAGKQYRALVTKAVDAGNGVTIPQGALATVTLVNSGNGSGWTTHLVSVTLNGQPVAVTSGPASMVGGIQSTATNAMNSVGSMLGGFGHHVKPTSVTAVATGQRVVLPPGAALTFDLTQPPAASGASASPAGQPMSASAAPAQPPQPSSAPVATVGQHWWLCQYVDPKDLSKPVLGKRLYFALFPSSTSPQNAGGNASPMAKHFIAYVQQNYKIVTALSITPSGEYNGTAGGYCRRVSDDDAGRSNSMNMMKKQWASSTPGIEALQVNFADTPGQDAAIGVKPGTPPLAPTVNSKECAYHATCSSQAPKP